jgi:hypothetical protein
MRWGIGDVAVRTPEIRISMRPFGHYMAVGGVKKCRSQPVVWLLHAAPFEKFGLYSQFIMSDEEISFLGLIDLKICAGVGTKDL